MQLLGAACETFASNQSQSQTDSSILSKLLIVLSDGRGIFYEGLDTVKKAVQRTIEERIFVVFIILDIPVPGKNFSIFDIKMPIHDKNSSVSGTMTMSSISFRVNRITFMFTLIFF